MHRGEAAYAVLNLYPYSPGHLMVCPYRHVADYTDLTTTRRPRWRRFTKTRDAHGPRGQRRRTASTSA